MIEIKDNKLNVGDTIKCNSKAEMLMVDQQLITEGYKTDYCFRKNGEEGLWVVIEGVSE